MFVYSCNIFEIILRCFKRVWIGTFSDKYDTWRFPSDQEHLIVGPSGADDRGDLDEIDSGKWIYLFL